MKKYVLLLLLSLSFNTFANTTNLADISLKDLNNQTATLEKYKGKKVYIKMWASWCPICLAGLPELNELSGEKNNFEIIAIASPSQKGEKTTKKFIDWYKGLDYKNITILLDESGEIIKRARLRGYPTSVILDENLNIKSTQIGHLTKDQIKQKFE